MTGKRKPRKPKPLRSEGKKGKFHWARIYDGYVSIEVIYLNSREARRLAAWLLRFADWADSKSKGGKG